MKSSSVFVAPSILSADFGKLNEELETIKTADMVHIDIMDGHFVPNLTFGAPVMKMMQTTLIRDVHLMISKPWNYLKDFADAKADYLTFHIEACMRESTGGSAQSFYPDYKDLVSRIHDLGCKAGVALNPETPLEFIADIVDDVDLVLCMTVYPGFGGQAFKPEVLEKVKALRAHKPDLLISVDGGINAETGKLAVDAGANMLVAGNYVFKSNDRVKAIESLRN